MGIFTSLNYRFTILLLLFTFFEQIPRGKFFKLPVRVAHLQKQQSGNSRISFLEYLFLYNSQSDGHANIPGKQ
jgi:hypothetical protein